MAGGYEVKPCKGCDGTEEIMPPIENFIYPLNYIDAEPVPCPVCHPEFWENYPAKKANALRSIGCG